MTDDSSSANRTLSFGQALRDCRLAAGLTQAALAERAGLSDRTVQDLERGIARPRRDTIQRLRDALTLPPEILVQFEAAISAPRPNSGRERRRSTPAQRAGSLRAAPAPAQAAPQQLQRRKLIASPLTSFVGRERELADLLALLQSCRLITLTGPGGSGKTRLALEGARRAEPSFSDGAAFVSLASLIDPGLLPSTIAEALDVHEAKGLPLMRTLQEAIGDRSMLVVLDNFEHLLSASPVVSELLTACPRLVLIVTSRELLRISGEQVYPVPPLALPERGNPTAREEESVLRAGQSEAVRLFMDRARSVRPDFRLDASTAPAVTAICIRLDGLPLAVELAAARIRHLSLEALHDRLESRLSLLTGGSRDVPRRQQTLRNTIGWSYDLLREDEQVLFSRIAIFAGGCTLDAIEAVVTDVAPGTSEPAGPASFASHGALLDTVASLVDKSLVHVVHDSASEPRFAMLDTIREFGLEHVEASGDAERLRRSHAHYYVRLAERAQPELTRPEQHTWLNRLDADLDNLRAALDWSLDVSTADDEHVAACLVLALYRFWQRRNHLNEGRAWAERAIERHGPIRDAIRARLLNAAGVLARSQADCQIAQAYFEESLSIHRDNGDQRGIANALHNLGTVVHLQGDYARATALLDESLAMWPRLGDAWSHGMALAMRGHLARDQGDVKLAIQCYEASHDLAREVGDRWSISGSLGELGILALEQREFGRATDFLHRCLAVRGELGDLDGVARSLMHLGRVAFLQNDAAQAADLYRRSLRQYAEVGHRWGPIVCFEQLAAVAVTTQRPTYAAVLLGAAEAGRERIAEPLPFAARADHAQLVAEARSHLGDAAFGQARADGRAMTQAQAIAYALGEAPLATTSMSPADGDGPGPPHARRSSPGSRAGDDVP